MALICDKIFRYASLFSVRLASSLESTSIFISWTSFTSLCLPQFILLFSTFPIHHPFTLNSRLTFLVNLFPHRSLTIDTSDLLPQLMGPFSAFTVFVGVISCFGAVDKTSSSFSVHGKIGNFIIIIVIKYSRFGWHIRSHTPMSAM